MKNDVAIIGCGCSKFGELEQGYNELIWQAASEAIEDAGIEMERIEAAVLGTYSVGQEGGKAGPSLGDPLRLYGIPISRVENYCATGTDAVRIGAMTIASGMADVVLCVGAEKMKDRLTRGAPIEGKHPAIAYGVSAPGVFALFANRYFHRYGKSREDLSYVSVKNHKNGSVHPLAHIQKEITLEQHRAAPMIAAPFGLFDCCPTTDGAAAVVLCKADLASSFRDDAVLIRGLGLASTNGRPYFDPTNEHTGFEATQLASKQAYKMAGITDPKKEIDLAEVHDCFTWTELTNTEDLGFCGPGEAVDFVREGRTAPEGDIPINPSGGLKSFGHPIGATGVRMTVEVTRQLQGRAKGVQIENAETGLVHNVGGPGAVAGVLVLGR